MSMPALQRFRAARPDSRITLLTRPGLQALWQMHPAADQLQVLDKTLPVILRLRRSRFDRVYIFPNSFRSAFIPFMAGVPRRIGARGHWRRLMLTETVRLPDGHQQFESLRILGLHGDLPPPELRVPVESLQSMKQRLGDRLCSGKPVVTLLPGAARGPSKRWPAGHFVLLARKLMDECGAQIFLAGGPDDTAVCAEIAAFSGPEVIDLAGSTTLPEWAALLKISDCVVSNDSGGMHLATAVGTPVVALFGLTDPKKTGPLGRNIVLQKSSAQNRDIARDSEEAVRALAAVTPDDVFSAVSSLR